MSLTATNNSASHLGVNGAGNLSDDENSSSTGHTSDDDEENEDEDDGHPMMSIFASYYGMEDTAVVDNKPKGTIDDAGFQADLYVKVVFYSIVGRPLSSLYYQTTLIVELAYQRAI